MGLSLAYSYKTNQIEDFFRRLSIFASVECIVLENYGADRIEMFQVVPAMYQASGQEADKGA